MPKEKTENKKHPVNLQDVSYSRPMTALNLGVISKCTLNQRTHVRFNPVHFSCLDLTCCHRSVILPTSSTLCGIRNTPINLQDVSYSRPMTSANLCVISKCTLNQRTHVRFNPVHFSCLDLPGCHRSVILPTSSTLCGIRNTL